MRTMPIMSALAALRQTAPDPGPGQRGAREPPVSGDGDGEEEPPVTPVTCPVSPWCVMWCYGAIRRQCRHNDNISTTMYIVLSI